MIGKKLYFLLLIIFACFVQSCAPTLDQAKRHYDSGLRNYLSGEHYEAAENDFQNSAKTGFYLPGVYASIGVIQIKNGNVQSGLEYLEKEYGLYNDPVIKHYIDFIKSKYGIDNQSGQQGE